MVKMAQALSTLIQGPYFPAYLTTARVVPLSKDGTPYPNLDNIRTIAVLPAVSKLLELHVLLKLEPIIYGADGLHKAQQGFRPGAGTEINLARIIHLF